MSVFFQFSRSLDHSVTHNVYSAPFCISHARMYKIQNSLQKNYFIIANRNIFSQHINVRLVRDQRVITEINTFYSTVHYHVQ